MFINPYNFVPLPKKINRGSPQGHSRLIPGNLSGYVDVTYSATSPISTSTGEGGPVHLFGSSFHGAIRSLHETIAGGCLRVLDEDFVPIHRDHTGNARREIAIVRKFDESGLYLSHPSDVVDVPTKMLLAAARNTPTLVRTTAQVWLAFNDNGEVSGVSFEDDGSNKNAHRLLVTDTKARLANAPWFFKAVLDDSSASAHGVWVEPKVVSTFRQALVGASDQRTKAWDPSDNPDQKEMDGQRWVGVRGPREGALLGYRLFSGRDDDYPLVPDQPIFVRTDENDKVIEIALSAIWRNLGTDSIGKRLRGKQGACTDPADLCPSCQIFGSAEAGPKQEKEERNRATQQSYAGHVMISDATILEGQAGPISIQMPRVGSPNPGSGQFYLQCSEPGALPKQHKDRPLREWGSGQDKIKRRDIRGRKYYWTTTWESRRQQFPERDQADHVRTALPEGSVFRVRARFENLTKPQLGSLIAAMSPNIWLAEQGTDAETAAKARMRFGGGKPQGLGAAEVKSLGLTLVDHKHRWIGSSAADFDTPDAYVAAFVESVPQEVKSTWQALQQVLMEGAVNGSLVKYPPPVNDDAFYFWTRSVGLQTNKGEYPLARLPEATAPELQQNERVDN